MGQVGVGIGARGIGLIFGAVGVASLSLARIDEARASDPPRDPRCVEAGIASLRVLRAAPARTRRLLTSDACDGEYDGSVPGLAPAIDRLTDIHRRVAGALGLPSVAEVLPEGVHVVLSEEPLGSLASVAGGRDLTLGVLPGWAGQPLNLGIYAHELAHVLVDLEHPRVPAALPSFDAHPLMQETIADLVALAATGSLIDRGGDLPPCIDRVRLITDFQRYRYAESYFDDAFAFRRLARCCRVLEREGADDPVSAHWRETCAGPNLRRAFDSLPGEFSGRPAEATPPDASGRLGHGLSFDPHQIGIPLASFFVSVSRQTGIPLADLLRESLVRASESDRAITLRCGLAPEAASFVRDVRMHPVSALIDGLRDALAGRPADAAAFAAAERTHGLDYARALDAALLGPAALRRYGWWLRDQLGGEGHPCRDDDLNAACELGCEPATEF